MSETFFTKRLLLIIISNLIFNFKSLIIIPLIIKLLSIQDYGTWVMVITTVTIGTMVSTLGLSESVIRFIPQYSNLNDKKNIYYSLLCFSSIFGVIFSITIIVISEAIQFYLELSSSLIYLIAIIIPVGTSINISLSYFRGTLQIKQFSSFLIFRSFINISAFSFAIIANQAIDGIILYYIGSELIIGAFLLFMIFKELGFPSFNFFILKKSLKFSIPVLIFQFCVLFVISSDRYIITLFLGLRDVGLYSLAFSLALLPLQTIYGPLDLLLSPTVSKLYYEENHKEIRLYLNRSMKFFLILSIPISFGISFFSLTLLGLFSTNEIAKNSFYIVPFIASGFILYGIFYVILQVFKLYKKTNVIMIIWIMASILSLLLNILIIPTFGILGASFSFVLTMLFLVLLCFYIGNRKYSLEISFKFIFGTIIKSSVSSLIMLIFVIFLSSFQLSELFHLFISITLGAFIYFITLIILKGITLSEIRSLVQSLTG